MSKWRRSAEGCSFGFDLGDGLPPLLEFKFADDILIFARSFHEIMTLLDKLVQALGDGGLKLKTEKTVLITGLDTTVFDYFDRSRYQGEAKGIRSQMVGLHLVCSRFHDFNFGY